MTKLEKMAEIYRLTGIEPDMWEDDDVLYTTSEPEYGASNAHYTESKLWEMLPSFIGEYHKYVDGKGMGYVKNPAGIEVWLDFINLHEALTDMVLWCIEKNYIKKVVNDD